MTLGTSQSYYVSVSHAGVWPSPAVKVNVVKLLPDMPPHFPIGALELLVFPWPSFLFSVILLRPISLKHNCFYTVFSNAAMKRNGINLNMTQKSHWLFISYNFQTSSLNLIPLDSLQPSINETFEFIFYFFLFLGFCNRAQALARKREKKKGKMRNYPLGGWPRCNLFSSILLLEFWAHMHVPSIIFSHQVWGSKL